MRTQQQIDRERIQRDMEAFIQGGGKVLEIDNGVSGERPMATEVVNGRLRYADTKDRLGFNAGDRFKGSKDFKGEV